MAVDTLPMEINNNHHHDSIKKGMHVTVDTEGKPKRVTPYEKLTNDLKYDERMSKEISMGKRIGFYVLRGDLGSGNFSQVKLGIHSLARERVAIKILDKTKLDEKTQKLLSREISSMEKLRHPNIIRIYEVIETLTKIHMVMEYANGGELFHKILNEGKLPERVTKRYFAQVLSGVNHMHESNIIHRDIKAENVFISNSGTVKLGDLGFSTVALPGEALNTFCGSPPYAAPELFKDENYIGTYVDIWAIGVLLYFMVVGTMPFRAETVGKLKKRILEGSFSIPEFVSDSCRFLIKQILRPVPSDRFTIQEIMRSLWMESIEYPTAHKKFELGPARLGTEGNPEEREAFKCMLNVGIPLEAIQKAESNARNCITGTYRVFLHQVQRRSAEKQLASEAAEREQEQLKRASQAKRESTSKRTPSSSTKSKFCVIL